MSESNKRKDPSGGDDEKDKNLQWEDVKKARNRINSQRTRERERLQMETLESDKNRLALSNDALRYQNGHLRVAIQQILELRDMRRLRQMNDVPGRGGERSVGVGSLPRPGGVHSSGLMDTSRGRSALEQNAFLPSLPHSQMRYPGDLGAAHLAGMPPLGGPTLDDLRIRRQAALDVEAALLQRHRAAVAGIESLRPISQASMGLTGSAGMLHLPPSSQELMEMRQRQLRMQELSGMGGAAGMMGQLPRGFLGSAQGGPEAVAVRNLREDTKQETKQVDPYYRRERAER